MGKVPAVLQCRRGSGGRMAVPFDDPGDDFGVLGRFVQRLSPPPLGIRSANARSRGTVKSAVRPVAPPRDPLVTHPTGSRSVQNVCATSRTVSVPADLQGF